MTIRPPTAPLDRTLMAGRIGQFGLAYFAFSVFYGPAQANQGLLVILAALLLGKAINFGKLLRDPLFITSGLFLAYLLIRTLAVLPEELDRHKLIVDYATDWALLALLPALLVAAACRGGRLRPFHLLGLAVAGFFLKILLKFDWAHIGAYLETMLRLQGKRATFGFSSINLACWALFLLIGLIIYGDDYLRHQSRVRNCINLFMLIPALLFLVFIIIIAKSRTIWLLSGLFIPSCIFMQFSAATRSGRQAIAVIVILVLLIPAYFLATHPAFFQNRLMRENAVIASIIDSDDRDVPPTSVGRRYYMIRVFLENAGTRPVFGWGPGLSKQLLERSELPDMRKVDHFHNIYIEILLQLGLVGFGLFAAMFAVLTRAVFTVRLPDSESRKLRWFLCCSLLAFGLTGLLNNPLWSSATPYFFALLGGIAYTPRAHAYLSAAAPAIPSHGNDPDDRG